MDILEFDFSTEHGFAWIQVAGNDGEPVTIQCCLENVDGQAVTRIKKNDCGFGWGLCADANGQAVAMFGAEKCMAALFDEAAKNGIEVE